MKTTKEWLESAKIMEGKYDFGYCIKSQLDRDVDTATYLDIGGSIWTVATWFKTRGLAQAALDYRRIENGVAASKWQPIETAPMRKTIIVGDAVNVGSGWAGATGQWYAYGTSIPMETPTHWQPLPDPPTEAK